MASGTLRDITPAMVYGLAHDKNSEEEFGSKFWERFQSERPMLAKFVTSRLARAFPEQPDSQSRALEVMLEIISMDERITFADYMRDELGEVVVGIGGLALRRETDQAANQHTDLDSRAA